jgi:ketosteroid isomerase-like protein
MLGMHAAEQALRRWCEGLAGGDVTANVALLHEDVVVRAPFAPDPIPTRIDGREAFAGALQMLAPLFTTLTWTSLDIQAAADPDLACARASAAMQLPDGRPYTQDYAIFVRVAGGLIVEYDEYLDPVRAGGAVTALMGSAAG